MWEKSPIISKKHPINFTASDLGNAQPDSLDAARLRNAPKLRGVREAGVDGEWVSASRQRSVGLRNLTPEEARAGPAGPGCIQPAPRARARAAGARAQPAAAWLPPPLNRQVAFQVEHLRSEKGHRTGNKVKRQLTSRRSIQGEWAPPSAAPAAAGGGERTSTSL